MDQRVQEVDAEAHADDQADDGFNHALFSLQPVASGGVDAHQDEEQDPNDEIDNVSHVANPPMRSATCAPRACKLSMRQ
jgi:hypothetical protein